MILIFDLSLDVSLSLIQFLFIALFERIISLLLLWLMLASATPW